MKKEITLGQHVTLDFFSRDDETDDIVHERYSGEVVAAEFGDDGALRVGIRHTMNVSGEGVDLWVFPSSIYNREAWG